MQEPEAIYGCTRPATIDEALAALTRAALGDAQLRDWIINTARILNLLPAQQEETKRDMFESKTPAPSKTADSASKRPA